MNNLYHGSAFKHSELKSGFAHTGELMNWDETESNKFLYASTVESDALDQAFASEVERRYQTLKFVSTEDGHVTVYLKDEKLPPRSEIESIVAYVYVIKYLVADGWTKNNNEHNNLATEWKTPSTVPASSIKKIKEVRVGEMLLKKKLLKFITPNKLTLETLPGWSGWK